MHSLCGLDLPYLRSYSARRICSKAGADEDARAAFHRSKTAARIVQHNLHAQGYGHHVLEMLDGWPPKYKCTQCDTILEGRTSNVFAWFCKSWQRPDAGPNRGVTRLRIVYHNQQAGALHRHNLVWESTKNMWHCTICGKLQTQWLQRFLLQKCPLR